MKFVGLSAGRAVQLGIGHCDSSEAGDGGDEGLLVGSKDALGTRVDEDGTLGTSGSERDGQEHAGRNQVSQGMGSGIDRDGKRLAGSYCAGSEIGGETQGDAVVPSSR